MTTKRKVGKRLHLIIYQMDFPEGMPACMLSWAMKAWVDPNNFFLNSIENFTWLGIHCLPKWMLGRIFFSCLSCWTTSSVSKPSGFGTRHSNHSDWQEFSSKPTNTDCCLGDHQKLYFNLETCIFTHSLDWTIVRHYNQFQVKHHNCAVFQNFMCDFIKNYTRKWLVWRSA